MRPRDCNFSFRIQKPNRTHRTYGSERRWKSEKLIKLPTNESTVETMSAEQKLRISNHYTMSRFLFFIFHCYSYAFELPIIVYQTLHDSLTFSQTDIGICEVIASNCDWKEIKVAFRRTIDYSRQPKKKEMRLNEKRLLVERKAFD